MLITLLRLLGGGLLAVLSTVLSLRLLGIRRGWTTALAAGVLGWGGALVVSLAVNRWRWGADGLPIHVVALGVPGTMAVAVGLDLLARPGTLATGERSGLVVAPRPLRALRRRWAVLRRYRELVGLARREGFGPFASGGGGVGGVGVGSGVGGGVVGEEAADTPEHLGVRLRRVLESAGGVYVKLGQIAATRVDLLPAEICEELAKLQNRVAPEPTEGIAAVLRQELGQPVDALFEEFDWEPLAAASIGQTHCARLRSGEAVVVKVQRPGIEELMDRDLAALALVADLAQRRTSFGRGVRSGEVLAQFAAGLKGELDFRREADVMSELAVRLGPVSGVRIPRVHRHLCTRRVLVQERFEGCTVADSAGLDRRGVDRHALGHQLLRSTLDQVIRVGVFHADPHPGNVFALEDGTLGLIDFGAVGRLDPIQQSAIVDMFLALSRRDVALLRDGVERVVEVTATASADELERALARLVAENVRIGGTVEPTVFQDLVTTLARFGLRLPADLVLLSRALVTVDGTLRALTPDLSLMGSTALLTDPAIAKEFVDRNQLLRDELWAALPRLRRLPERVDRILALTSKGELRVRNVVDEDGRRILRTLVNRVLLAGVGATFLGVSTVLLVAEEEGPAVADGTGLFEMFGYGGILAGVVLLLRVVEAVARDGTT